MNSKVMFLYLSFTFGSLRFYFLYKFNKYFNSVALFVKLTPHVIPVKFYNEEKLLAFLIKLDQTMAVSHAALFMLNSCRRKHHVYKLDSTDGGIPKRYMKIIQRRFPRHLHTLKFCLRK